MALLDIVKPLRLHKPPSPSEDMVVAVLTRARDLVHDKGWIQGEAQAFDGRVCLGFALDTAMLDLGRSRASYRGAPTLDRVQTVVLDAIEEIHGMRFAGDIIAYNDRSGRTREEIMEVLDRSLKLAGAG